MKRINSRRINKVYTLMVYRGYENYIGRLCNTWQPVAYIADANLAELIANQLNANGILCNVSLTTTKVMEVTNENTGKRQK